MNGYIKLHRKLMQWEWYKDIPTKTLYIHLLLKASWSDLTYRGREIPSGTIVTTVRELSEETRLSPQQIKTAFSHLKSTNEITIKTTNKETVIHIEKWGIYQCDEERINNAVNKVIKYQPINNQ